MEEVEDEGEERRDKKQNEKNVRKMKEEEGFEEEGARAWVARARRGPGRPTPPETTPGVKYGPKQTRRRSLGARILTSQLLAAASARHLRCAHSDRPLRPLICAANSFTKPKHRSC